MPFVKGCDVSLVLCGAEYSGETVFDKVPVEDLIGSAGTLNVDFSEEA